MEILWAVLDVGLLGGLVAALFLMIRTSRRRSRHIAGELAAELTPTHSAVVISANRRRLVVGAACFGFVMLAAVRFFKGDTIALGIALEMTFGSMLFSVTRRAVWRGPLLVLDDYGIAFVRADRMFAWTSCDRIYVRSNAFLPDHHELVCELKPDAPELIKGDEPVALKARTIRLRLDALSMPWNEIVAACQVRLGRHIANS